MVIVGGTPVAGVGVLVAVVEIWDPVTNSSTAAEQVAMETLPALAALPPAEGTWVPAEKEVNLATVLVTELPI